MHQHLLDGLRAQVAHSLDVGAQHDHIGYLCIAQLIGDVQAGHINDPHIVPLYLLGDDGAVDKNGAALNHIMLKLAQRGQIHGNQFGGLQNDGTDDLVLGDNHTAVGSAATHLRAVGGQPGNILAFLHAGLCQGLADGHNALSAETGDHDFIGHLTLPPRQHPCRLPTGSRESCFPSATQWRRQESCPSWWGSRPALPQRCSPCPPSASGTPS